MCIVETRTHCWRKLKRIYIIRKTTYVHGQKTINIIIFQMAILTKLIQPFSTIPTKIQDDLYIEIYNFIPKFHMEIQEQPK